MRKRFRKMMAIFMTFAIITLIIPYGSISVNAYSIPNENEFSAKIAELQSRYVDGKYWNKYSSPDYSRTGDTPCTGYGLTSHVACTSRGYCADSNGLGCTCLCGAYVLNGVEKAWQCMGFAYKMGHECFGVSPYSWDKSFSLGTVCAGDIIRINNDFHTIFVYKVDGSTIYYADCNRTGPCRVSWGNTYSYSELSSRFKEKDYKLHLSGNNLSGNGAGGSGIVDIGTDFYACIINTPSWKHVSVAYDNNVLIRKGKPVASADQLWHFERQNDGSYKISTLANDYCLDVQYGDTSAGANIQVYPCNDSDAQRWFITGYSGNYRLRPKCSECVLDLYNGSTTDDTNVQLYNINNSDAQKFEIYKGNETPFAADMGSGFIAPLVHKASWITLENDINNDLTIQKANASPRQFWKFVRQADGSYKIYSCYDGKCVDVEGGSLETGANVRLYDENSTDAQRWYFYSVNGEYMIQSKLTGKFLDLPTPTYGASLYQWDRNYTAAQIFSVYRGAESAMINPTLSVSASKNAHFLWDDVQAENNYSLKIWESSTNSDESIFSKEDISENSTELIVDLPAGKYYGILSAYNIYQNMKSNTVEFEIAPYIDTTVTFDEHVTILHGSVYGATEYDIEIYNAENNELVKFSKSLPETTIDLSLKNGNYFAVMKTDNGIHTEKSYFSIKKPIIGDTNLDGNININDVTSIQRHLADLETFTEEQLAVADTNGDGVVDIADATHLQMYFAEYDVVLGKQS